MNIKRITTILIATTVLTVPAIQIKESIQDIEYNKKAQVQMQIRTEELRIAAEEAFQKEEARLAEEQAEAERVAAEELAALEAAQAAEAEQERIDAIAAAKAAESVAPAVSQAPASGGNCESYRALVSQYDWNVNTMLRIMRAESGCNPSNHNYADAHRTCTGSYGLMQIGCVHGYSIAHLESPSNNIAAAYQIYKSQGYTAWTTF